MTKTITLYISEKIQTSNIEGSRSSGFRVSPLNTYQVLEISLTKQINTLEEREESLSSKTFFT